MVSETERKFCISCGCVFWLLPIAIGSWMVHVDMKYIWRDRLRHIV